VTLIDLQSIETFIRMVHLYRAGCSDYIAYFASGSVHGLPAQSAPVIPLSSVIV